MNDHAPATAVPGNDVYDGNEVYEIRVSGTVGPLARAALSGFEFEVEPRFTVVTGAPNTCQDLAGLLDALRSNGCAVEDLHVTATGAAGQLPASGEERGTSR